MKIKYILLLFLLSCIIFSFYFLREDMVGADGYYYLNHICKKDAYLLWKNTPSQITLDGLTKYFFTNVSESEPPLSNLVFSLLLPCDFIAIKLVLFCLFFLSLLSIAFLGCLFDEKNGWKAGLFAFLTPLLVWEFIKIENDQFAFPLLLWSMYFFVKGQMKSSLKEKIINQAVAMLLVLAACGFWGGGLYYFVAYAMGSILAYIIAVPVLVFLGKRLWDNAMPLLGVYENMPLLATFYLLIPSWFIFYADSAFLPQLLFFFILAMLNAKFSIHALPLLCVCVLKAYTHKRLNTTAWWPIIMKTLLVLSILIGIIGGINILRMPPEQSQWQAIDSAISISKAEGRTLYNDWDLGYWIQWRDYTASNWAGGGDLNFSSFHNAAAVSQLDTNVCGIAERIGEYKIYRCD